MQLSGVFKVKRKVLAENTTLHEPYKSVELELVGPLTFIIEEPRYIDDVMDKDGEIGIIFQLTPSGTIDPKTFPTVTNTSDEDKVEARQVERDKDEIEARKKTRESERKAREEKAKEDFERNVRARAQTKLLAEQEKAKNDQNKKVAEGVNNAPEPTEEQLDEARKELEKENSDSSKSNVDKGTLGEKSPIKANLTDSGKLVQDETKKDEKKDKFKKTPRGRNKYRRVK